MYRFVRTLLAACLALGLAFSAGAVPGGGASNSHSVLLMPDGTVWTSGSNSNGEVGDGSNQPRHARVHVLSGATSVDIGSNHTVALVGGGARFWGHNGFGQNCNPDETLGSYSTPRSVPGSSALVGVAATSLSTFLLHASGTVASCGANYSGVLGDGSAPQWRREASPVAGLTDAVAISGGVSHVLALRANGTVVGWGENSYGQLGDDSASNRSTPVAVSGLTNVTAVSAGQVFSMALDAAGQVWVWGGNGTSGMTNGDGTTANHLTPYPVPGLSNVVQIAAGSGHAVALDATGHVWTWGGSGGGVGEAPGGRKVAAVVAGLPIITAIAAGQHHTYAFAQDGSLYAWGANSSAQLGDGTIESRYSPIVLADAGGVWRTGRPVFSPNPATTYGANQTVQITSATAGAVVRYTTTGVDPIETDAVVPTGGLLVDQNRTFKARAWKAGQGPSYVAAATYTFQPAMPTISPGAGTYTSPRSVTLATTTAGATIRYTTNGSEPTSSSPVYSAAIPISTQTTLRAKAFKAGWTDSASPSATYSFNYGTLDAPVISPAGGTYSTDQTVSLTLPNAPSGAVIRYTSNGSDPSMWSTVYAGPIPVATGLTLKARAFHADWTQSAVASATYAFTAATPTFTQASGTHPAGQVVAIATGTPNATIRYTLTGLAPTGNDPVFWPGSTLTLGDYTLKATAFKTGYTTSGTAMAAYQINGDVTPARIAAGNTHTLVVKRDGTPWGFGSNGSGYLGDNSTTARSLPVRAAGATGIKDVAAGSQHSLAVGLDGRVYSWGTNTSGQQGDGATIGYRSAPWPVPAVTNAVAVAAGHSHSLALTNTGQVYAWGLNGDGQLGLGNTSPQPTPTLIPGLTGIAGIAAGETHSLAWTTNGVLYAWGNNGNGKLGDNSQTHRTSPVVVTGITGVAEAAAGQYHSMVRTSSGQVWTWGRSLEGALGLGNTDDRWVPTQVTSLAGVQAIGVGHRHSLASDATTTYVWGKNNSSQVGNGLTANQMSPYATSLGPSIQLAGGSLHSVALAASGVVSTWGGNGSGQLGNGTTTPVTTPAPISDEGQIWGASAPVASPLPGWYDSSQAVTLTSATSGATIRYTTNGADPTVTDTVASTPVQIGETTTLKARAWKAGLDPSPVRTFGYAIAQNVPTISPNGGAFTAVQSATISIGLPGAIIHYTTSGAEPQEADATVASGSSIVIDRSMTLKVRAWKPGVGAGAVESALFVLQAQPPTAQPAGGTYDDPQTVVLGGPDGTKVRFTLDGTDPSEASPEFQQPLTIWESTTVKARAFRTGWTPSDVKTDVYTIQLPAPTTAMVAHVSPAPNAVGWNNTPVTVSFLCGDVIAPEDCPAPLTVATEGDNQVITRSVVDANGDTVTASATLRLDFTPPVVTITDPIEGSSTLNPTATINAAVADALSGASTATCILSAVQLVQGVVTCNVGLAKGRNTLFVQSSDLAGNSASAAVRLTRTGASTAITITPSTMTLLVGAERTLTAFDDFGVQVQGATWSLSEPSVAELVNSSGVVSLRALAAGTTTITTTVGEVSTAANLTVSDGVYSGNGEPLALGQGTELWSVSADEPAAVYTNTLAVDVPDVFLVESNAATRTLRALSADGIENWREPAPYLRDSPDSWGRAPMGDSFGGIVMTSNERDNSLDTSNWGVMLRMGGGTTFPWMYKAEYTFRTKTAQDFNGVISVVEWNWQHSTMTRTSTSILLEYPGWLLRVDGRTGQRLSRIPLPLTPTCHRPNYCKSEPWIWSDPVVGADGSTYMLVSAGYRNNDVQSGDVVSAWHTLQLLRVQPDGSYTFRELAQGVGSAGGGADDWPDALAASPDGRLLGIRTSGVGAPVWVIDSTGVSFVSLPAGVAAQNVTVATDQVLIGGSGSTTSFNLSTMTQRWNVPGEVVAPTDGGVLVREAGSSQVTAVGPEGQALGVGTAGDRLWGVDTWLSSGGASFSARIGVTASLEIYDINKGGNRSSQSKPAINELWFPPFDSGRSPAVKNALADLIANLAVPAVAAAANQFVFGRLGTTNAGRTVTAESFRNYLLTPGGIVADGTHSLYCVSEITRLPLSGPCFESFATRWLNATLVRDVFSGRMPGMQGVVVDAMSDPGPGNLGRTPFLIFLRPRAIRVQNFGRGITNEGMLFHEALHTYTGKSDNQLFDGLRLARTQSTCVISEWIQQKVLALVATLDLGVTDACPEQPLEILNP